MADREGGATVRLTPREADTLRLLRDGLSDREIAESLSISVATVRTHLESLSTKLGTRGRGRIAARSREIGLV